ncbi:MAG: glucose-6-phosphate dehydrogenase assembly protein OpcA [Actinobacteria bacterium]|nr:glucose-6-phosphate dehydrogenase assembly protein OpcA [Actinomycetota bacterium]
MATVLGLENTSVRAIEREIARLRAEASSDGSPNQRTSVMNHIAWVPERWEDQATQTLAGLEERHPSRAILLFPRPDDEHDAIDANVDLRCYARGKGDCVCFEVIELWLRGGRARAPASIVEPLLQADLPDFLRWRGDLPFGERQLLQLTDVAERLIVDSSEWRDPETAYARLAELFEEVKVSDIAWARIEPWREAVAGMWPGVADGSTVRVAGPEADALLLAAWLRTRLSREVGLEHEPAGEIELVELDGEPARLTRAEPKSASDLLSDQLDVFGRDDVYEEAVRSFSSPRI